MSGAATGSTNSAKASTADSKDSAPPSQQQQKAAAQLEEDDEFEDFPVEDWSKEEEVGQQTQNTHLWEESWDDDDTSDDFANQLKEELQKMGSARKS